MLRIIFQFFLIVFFIWALIYPFIQIEDSEQKDTATSEVKKPKKKKEKPLHDVSLPKFSEFTNVKEKKQAFFDFLSPHIEAENKKILLQRVKLEIAGLMLANNQPLNTKLKSEIKKIFKSYGLPVSISPFMIKQALRRVDIIPKELALIQAAKESAWGTSRFARIGLNFFGQWCYKKGCGMVPKRRNFEAIHEVAAFKSVRAAVNSYFKNINTHSAYKGLRTIRENLRDQAKPVSAIELTHGLMAYSERGEVYIEELNKMINQNRAYFDE